MIEGWLEELVEECCADKNTALWQLAKLQEQCEFHLSQELSVAELSNYVKTNEIIDFLLTQAEAIYLPKKRYFWRDITTHRKANFIDEYRYLVERSFAQYGPPQRWYRH